MKIVFSGAGPVTVTTAQALIKKGHEIIIIEVDKETINQLSEDLDCGFLQGDASKPAILSQANPKDCDFLFCLTDSDKANIITALLGRSMGFKRVVPSIEDAEIQKLCDELELENTIIPVRTMSQHLENMVLGLHNIEIATFLKYGTRLFSFILEKGIETQDDLDLPDDTRIIFYYRGEKKHFFEADVSFKKGDEIVLLTQAETLSELQERWSPSTVDKKSN